jgi:hypothetical protein
MKSYKKALNILGTAIITTLTLTFGLQDNAMAMTTPGTEIVAGTPEPVIEKSTDMTSDKENSPTKKENKAPNSKKTTKNTVEKPEL